MGANSKKNSDSLKVLFKLGIRRKQVFFGRASNVKITNIKNFHITHAGIDYF
jgi:hypothetical protein